MTSMGDWLMLPSSPNGVDRKLSGKSGKSAKSGMSDVTEWDLARRSRTSCISDSESSQVEHWEEKDGENPFVDPLEVIPAKSNWAPPSQWCNMDEDEKDGNIEKEVSREEGGGDRPGDGGNRKIDEPELVHKVNEDENTGINESKDTLRRELMFLLAMMATSLIIGIIVFVQRNRHRPTLDADAWANINWVIQSLLVTEYFSHTFPRHKTSTQRSLDGEAYSPPWLSRSQRTIRRGPRGLSEFSSEPSNSIIPMNQAIDRRSSLATLQSLFFSVAQTSSRPPSSAFLTTPNMERRRSEPRTRTFSLHKAERMLDMPPDGYARFLNPIEPSDVSDNPKSRRSPGDLMAEKRAYGDYTPSGLVPLPLPKRMIRRPNPVAVARLVSNDPFTDEFQSLASPSKPYDSVLLRKKDLADLVSPTTEGHHSETTKMGSGRDSSAYSMATSDPFSAYGEDGRLSVGGLYRNKSSRSVR